MNPIAKAVVWWKLLKAGLILVRDPSKLNEVFDIADTLFESEREMTDAMVNEAREHEQGRKAFALRPRVGDVRRERLLSLPEGSLGRAFGDFLQQRNLDPAALPTREAADDRTYLSAHLYETHDLWHVVTGFETDVAGELGLQAFYAAQVCGKLPVALLTLGLLNTFLYAFDDRHRRLEAIAHGWQLGKRVRPLVGYDWGTSFTRPLSAVKADLGFPATGSAMAA
jgi:ubiquinone biosynthesis protein Coq4